MLAIGLVVAAIVIPTVVVMLVIRKVFIGFMDQRFMMRCANLDRYEQDMYEVGRAFFLFGLALFILRVFIVPVLVAL